MQTTLYDALLSFGDCAMSYEEAVKIAREYQDAEAAVKALEDKGCRFAVARSALFAVFGYDVLKG